jgi:hypothetical protein
MNATARLTPDLPFDALDSVIESLDHVLPVFSDRPGGGVNTRYCWSFASFLSSQAQEIALTTQYARQKKIIPATPKLLVLKGMALKAAGEIESLQCQESASEHANAAVRRSLAGVARRHIGELLTAITSLESHWGSFDIWIKNPKWATCDHILAAMLNRDLDAEQYLSWFLRSELKRKRDLAPYVAAVLWTEGGRKWREWDESSIYPRIIRRARKRKYWDERDAKLLTPSPNTISLVELEKLPELVCDPLELIFSSETPIKLATLRDMSLRLPFDDRLTGLNLTYEELQYFKLKKICGLKQVEVREHLHWDDPTLQRVKRATDRKLRQASSQKQV